MKFYETMGLSLTAALLSACNVQSNGSDASKQANSGAEGAIAPTGSADGASTATAIAGEPGSGVYAVDCSVRSSEFAIQLKKSNDGFVEGQVDHAGKRYAGLLTSYSYKGDATPPDFHIAVMFDGANSPVPVPADGDPRIELWKGEAAYYGLINGEKAQRLLFCN